jgi:hypothetical protein
MRARCVPSLNLHWLIALCDGPISLPRPRTSLDAIGMWRGARVKRMVRNEMRFFQMREGSELCFLCHYRYYKLRYRTLHEGGVLSHAA